jgi:chromosome segregation ATPase
MLIKERGQKSAREGFGLRHAQRAVRAEEALIDSKRTLNSFRSEVKGQDVKLVKALEEVERLRTTLVKERATHKQEAAHTQAALHRLQGQVKRMEKEREEIRTAFHKQAQLIQVLKKQKAHLQAAQLVVFTEKEFNSVLLDWQDLHTHIPTHVGE